MRNKKNLITEHIQRFYISVLGVGCLIAILFVAVGCSSDSSDRFTCYSIDFDTKGCMETVNHIQNVSIMSNDSNVFKAEYEAGFIQGKLQRNTILSARDNFWDMAYLVDPSQIFPKQIPPSAAELQIAQDVLMQNLDYTLNYLASTDDALVAKNLQRIFYRMLGIYHGAAGGEPAPLDFGQFAMSLFSVEDLKLGYNTPNLTFIDIYYINAYEDVMDVLDDIHDDPLIDDPDKCSAFVKKTANDIYITHNSWSGYLNQSNALTMYINGDYLTVNTITPGSVVSNTDFGYNNKGIMFNETTHHATYTEPKITALWMFVRAALAEQFSSSLDEFFRYISLEPSGTYMNGYMIVDTKTEEIGLIEMSFKNFIYFKSDGTGGYIITTKPDGISKTYDQTMVQSDYIIGINYPASQQIRDDLKAVDTRPARKRQFLYMKDTVKDIESSKALITYTDPSNPLSIYGRWDLGYGETDYPKTVPDGSIDAKAISASMISYIWNLNGILDLDSPNPAFWMKYGTPYVNGKPFIWSESQWEGQILRDVPDSQDGEFTLLKSYIR